MTPGPTVRPALPEEFAHIGNLMVGAYSQLAGFPSQAEQPRYYHMLANVGEMTKLPGVELLASVSAEGIIDGAVVYVGDMKHYGSGGMATAEKDAAGFRLLAVDPGARGNGAGKRLTLACINKAKASHRRQLIIHTTRPMQTAWSMYERLGFQRAPELDFKQDTLEVFGFRLLL